MRVIFIVILFTLSVQGHAQWATGIYPATACPTPMFPAPGAVSGTDPIANLVGKARALDAKLEQLNLQREHVAKYVDEDLDQIGKVLTDGALEAVETHYIHKKASTDYRVECGSGQTPTRAKNDGDTVSAEWFDSTSPAKGDQTSRAEAPPPQFCATDSRGIVHNSWQYVVEDSGTVTDTVCDHSIPKVTHSSSSHDRKACREGLHNYYKDMAKKIHLDKEIAELDEEASDIKNKLGRIDDRISEGTYCAACEARRLSESGLSTVDSLNQNNAILRALGSNNNVAPLLGYQANPYVARIPGYYNLGAGGVYGGVPGGIGTGTFACQGANPSAMGNAVPLALTGNNAIFANPFALNPANGLLNTGAGPWGYPQLGNGLNGNPFLLPQNQFGLSQTLTNPAGFIPVQPNTYTLGIQPSGVFPPYGSPLLQQMNLLNNGLQGIQGGGLYYGGSQLGVPSSFSPIYNSPTYNGSSLPYFNTPASAPPILKFAP